MPVRQFILASSDESEPQPAYCRDSLKAAEVKSFLRSPLILQRVATLFTVWSNCLAGWWLGGGDRLHELPFLFTGASLLYVGGTLWNDAFAVRPGPEIRSTPSVSTGAMGVSAAQGWGLALLALGVFCLFWLGNASGVLGLVLTTLILVVQVLHRFAAFSAILPIVCRFFLYLIGASAGVIGVTGGPIWHGLALALYVTGVTCLPRQKHVAGPERHWPILLLAMPIFLALIVDDDGAREAGLLLSAVVALWTVRCLRPALWSAEKDFDGASAGLVAGIALVDLLAVADAPKLISAVFIALFLGTRALQHVRTEGVSPSN
jgi:hypothetical protein